MKTLLKNIVGVCTLAMLLACAQSTPKSTTTEHKIVKSSDSIQLKDSAQDELLKQYLVLKDALVSSNAATAQKEATTLTSLLKASAGFEKSVSMSDSIAKTNDLVKQRSTFTNLSNELITQFRKESLLKGSFYVQFCPMANEGNGGYWLSAEQEVRNPYYGDEMLNCGEVKETIRNKD
ncbi:MAG: DUF3347 domain-containing protein [Sphingobacteriaceae bacterium]